MTDAKSKTFFEHFASRARKITREQVEYLPAVIIEKENFTAIKDAQNLNVKIDEKAPALDIFTREMQFNDEYCRLIDFKREDDSPAQETSLTGSVDEAVRTTPKSLKPYAKKQIEKGFGDEQFATLKANLLKRPRLILPEKENVVRVAIGGVYKKEDAALKIAGVRLASSDMPLPAKPFAVGDQIADIAYMNAKASLTGQVKVMNVTSCPLLLSPKITNQGFQSVDPIIEAMTVVADSSVTNENVDFSIRPPIILQCGESEDVPDLQWLSVGYLILWEKPAELSDADVDPFQEPATFLRSRMNLYLTKNEFRKYSLITASRVKELEDTKSVIEEDDDGDSMLVYTNDHVDTFIFKANSLMDDVKLIHYGSTLSLKNAGYKTKKRYQFLKVDEIDMFLEVLNGTTIEQKHINLFKKFPARFLAVEYTLRARALRIVKESTKVASKGGQLKEAEFDNQAKELTLSYLLKTDREDFMKSLKLTDSTMSLDKLLINSTKIEEFRTSYDEKLKKAEEKAALEAKANPVQPPMYESLMRARDDDPVIDSIDDDKLFDAYYHLLSSIPEHYAAGVKRKQQYAVKKPKGMNPELLDEFIEVVDATGFEHAPNPLCEAIARYLIAKLQATVSKKKPEDLEKVYRESRNERYLEVLAMRNVAHRPESRLIKNSILSNGVNKPLTAIAENDYVDYTTTIRTKLFEFLDEAADAKSAIDDATLPLLKNSPGLDRDAFGGSLRMYCAMVSYEEGISVPDLSNYYGKIGFEVNTKTGDVDLTGNSDKVLEALGKTIESELSNIEKLKQNTNVPALVKLWEQAKQVIENDLELAAKKLPLATSDMEILRDSIIDDRLKYYAAVYDIQERDINNDAVDGLVEPLVTQIKILVYGAMGGFDASLLTGSSIRYFATSRDGRAIKMRAFEFCKKFNDITAQDQIGMPPVPASIESALHVTPVEDLSDDSDLSAIDLDEGEYSKALTAELEENQKKINPPKQPVNDVALPGDAQVDEKEKSKKQKKKNNPSAETTESSPSKPRGVTLKETFILMYKNLLKGIQKKVTPTADKVKQKINAEIARLESIQNTLTVATAINSVQIFKYFIKPASTGSKNENPDAAGEHIETNIDNADETSDLEELLTGDDLKLVKSEIGTKTQGRSVGIKNAYTMLLNLIRNSFNMQGNNNKVRESVKRVEENIRKGGGFTVSDFKDVIAMFDAALVANPKSNRTDVKSILKGEKVSTDLSEEESLDLFNSTEASQEDGDRSNDDEDDVLSDPNQPVLGNARARENTTERDEAIAKELLQNLLDNSPDSFAGVASLQKRLALGSNADNPNEDDRDFDLFGEYLKEFLIQFNGIHTDPKKVKILKDVYVTVFERRVSPTIPYDNEISIYYPQRSDILSVVLRVFCDVMENSGVPMSAIKQFIEPIVGDNDVTSTELKEAVLNVYAVYETMKSTPTVAQPAPATKPQVAAPANKSGTDKNVEELDEFVRLLLAVDDERGIIMEKSINTYVKNFDLILEESTKQPFDKQKQTTIASAVLGSFHLMFFDAEPGSNMPSSKADIIGANAKAFLKTFRKHFNDFDGSKLNENDENVLQYFLRRLISLRSAFKIGTYSVTNDETKLLNKEPIDVGACKKILDDFEKLVDNVLEDQQTQQRASNPTQQPNPSNNQTISKMDLDRSKIILAFIQTAASNFFSNPDASTNNKESIKKIIQWSGEKAKKLDGLTVDEFKVLNTDLASKTLELLYIIFFDRVLLANPFERYPITTSYVWRAVFIQIEELFPPREPDGSRQAIWFFIQKLWSIRSYFRFANTLKRSKTENSVSSDELPTFEVLKVLLSELLETAKEARTHDYDEYINSRKSTPATPAVQPAPQASPASAPAASVSTPTIATPSAPASSVTNTLTTPVTPHPISFANFIRTRAGVDSNQFVGLENKYTVATWTPSWSSKKPISISIEFYTETSDVVYTATSPPLHFYAEVSIGNTVVSVYKKNFLFGFTEKIKPPTQSSTITVTENGRPVRPLADYFKIPRIGSFKISIVRGSDTMKNVLKSQQTYNLNAITNDQEARIAYSVYGVDDSVGVVVDLHTHWSGNLDIASEYVRLDSICVSMYTNH